MLKTINNNINLRLFFIFFCALNFVFAYYQITFFWGNHDWDWVKGTTQVLQWNTGMFEGRYAKFFLNSLLFGGQVLPILNTETAFLLLSLGSTLLIKYWQIKDEITGILAGLIAILTPCILGWLYFPINIIGNFLAVTAVCSGLLLNENPKIWHKVAGASCFLIALGVYPSVMEMMIICFCFRYIIKPDNKPIIKPAVWLIASLLLFKILLLILGKLGFIYDGHYNMQIVTVMELIKRTPEMIKLIFLQLITGVPFVSLKIKLIGLSLIVISVFAARKHYISIILLGLALGATVLSTWLTKSPDETAYMPRVNFYSLSFLYAGCTALLLNQKGLIRNAGMALSLLLIWQNVLNDFEASKVWQLGRTAEINLTERITGRIEEREKKHLLIPVVAGEMPLRPKYYHTSYQKESPYVLNGALLVRHIPSGMFNFYAIEPPFYGYSGISEISPELYQYLSKDGKSWPNKNALFVDDVYAVILLTPKGVKNIRDQLPY